MSWDAGRAVCVCVCVCGGNADLLTRGTGMLATQHKGSGGSINALSTRPPVTTKPRQCEHHLLLVGHGSMMHGCTCTSACLYTDLL